MGISAYEEGLCIHFDPPKNMDELNKIRSALQAKNLTFVES
jgi:lactam utilization protein B